MGLNGAGLNRFRERIDDTLADAYPAKLLFSTDGNDFVLRGSGPGARLMSEYRDGGESMNFRFPFRVILPPGCPALEIGMSVDWVIAASSPALPLEIIETSVRPHEMRASIVCRNRRQ